MASVNKLGRVLVLGGDKRQLSLHKRLSLYSRECKLLGFSPNDRLLVGDEMTASDIVVLPLPLTRDGITLNSDRQIFDITITEIAEMTRPGQLIFAGSPCYEHISLLEKKGAVCADYFADEVLLEYNSRLSAQGLLLTVLNLIEKDISGLPLLIVGYGRLGRASAALFGKCGFDVSVVSRSASSLNMARRDGFKGFGFNFLEALICGFDVIINTVPCQVISSRALERTNRGALLFESASAPYGFDRAYALSLGRKAFNCPGLPGKHTPVSAGEAIADTIIRMFGE